MLLVAGEALIDLIIDVDGQASVVLGGAPFNTARACGRLGCDVAFVGAISNDRFGSMLTQQLEADGVSTSLLTRVDEPTTLATAELDDGGSATYRFYLDGTSAPQLVESPSTRETSAVFAGGLGLALDPMAATIESMIRTRPQECLAMIDVNCRPSVIRDHALYGQRIGRITASSDVVKVSDEDLTYLHPTLDPLQASMEILKSGASVVLVTKGSDQVDIHISSGSASVKVNAVTVVDTIGAGDAFAAGFLTWWMATKQSRRELGSLATLSRAVSAANIVAGRTCERLGAHPPPRSELPTDWAT